MPEGVKSVFFNIHPVYFGSGTAAASVLKGFTSLCCRCSLKANISAMTISPNALFMVANSISSGLFSSRTVHSDDGPLLPEEEDWIFCHPDVHALLYDCNPVPGVILAQQRIGSCEDRLR